MKPSDLIIEPLKQFFGATVRGLDMSGPLAPEVVQTIRKAWLEHQVLFFPDCHFTESQQIALGSAFGELAALSRSNDDYRNLRTAGPNNEVFVLRSDEARAERWHSDVTFTAQPPIGSLALLRVVPPRGGETLWSSQYAAYEGLSAPVKMLIEDMKAEHGHPKTGSSIHPVVLRHSETGRKALFVSRAFTKKIIGLTQTESDGLLEMLFNQGELEDFQIRWEWQAGDAALWDNRCTMHRGVSNYGNARRELHRVTIYSPEAKVRTPELPAERASAG
jgi:taurine dioxygenase